METYQGIFFYMSKTFITWQERLQVQSTNLMGVKKTIFNMLRWEKKFLLQLSNQQRNIMGTLHSM